MENEEDVTTAYLYGSYAEGVAREKSDVDIAVEFKKNSRTSLFDLVRLAKTQGADIHGIYIPVNPNIHSNRGDIQKVVQGQKYRTATIPPVHWSSQEEHDFSEVFVVWEGK